MLRRSRGLSQEQLAAELDVSRQAISKWECGDSTPDLDKLRTICTYFGVTTDYLIWENEEDVLTGGANTAEPMKRENVRETLRRNDYWAGYVLAIIGAALLLRLLVSIIVMLSLGGWDAFPAVLWTCLPHILAYAVLIAGGIFACSLAQKKRGEAMTTFDKVYAAVRLIPRGSVATYGQIAAAIGNKRLARVVGYALHVNPEPGVIPCHRVVKRDGEVSSAFAFGGANRQVELLKAEGVGFLDDSHVDMKHCCVRALPLILDE